MIVTTSNDVSGYTIRGLLGNRALASSSGRRISPRVYAGGLKPDCRRQHQIVRRRLQRRRPAKDAFNRMVGLMPRRLRPLKLPIDRHAATMPPSSQKTSLSEVLAYGTAVKLRGSSRCREVTSRSSAAMGRLRESLTSQAWTGTPGTAAMANKAVHYLDDMQVGQPAHQIVHTMLLDEALDQSVRGNCSSILAKTFSSRIPRPPRVLFFDGAWWPAAGTPRPSRMKLMVEIRFAHRRRHHWRWRRDQLGRDRLRPGSILHVRKRDPRTLKQSKSRPDRGMAIIRNEDSKNQERQYRASDDARGWWCHDGAAGTPS